MKRMRSRFEPTGLTSRVTRGRLADMPETPSSHARTPVDLFQKARDHERRELIELARREDLMPYFRQVESEAGPAMRMEGRERLMLGSNNYLGLTGDLRVKAAARAAGDGGGVLVVVDGVYSMEGDVCDVAGVSELCRAHGARLMVDEAHGVGVLGQSGAGACELFGVDGEVDLRMGTFSKSLASCGGFIAGSAEVIEYLRYQSRSFMFTASAVPAAIGAALAAIRICRSGEGPELFARVLGNPAYLRAGPADLG